MKSLTFKKGIFALTAVALLMASCSKNDNPAPVPEEGTDKYVLITMSDNILLKPGFATAFNTLPSGQVSNNTQGSLQGLGFGGWRPHGNSIYKMFSTDANSLGIEKLQVDIAGKVSSANFIAGDNKTNGTGNFVIVDDTKGYYWDGAQPLKIQTFNPSTMSRTGEFDLSSAVNERGASEAKILYRSIGQKFLAVKGGKLYANITYANTNGNQKGYWDDFYKDVSSVKKIPLLLNC